MAELYGCWSWFGIFAERAARSPDALHNAPPPPFYVYKCKTIVYESENQLAAPAMATQLCTSRFNTSVLHAVHETADLTVQATFDPVVSTFLHNGKS